MAPNFCVQPNWNKCGMSGWNNHSSISSESSRLNESDTQELSGNITPYEDHSYSTVIKLKNGHIQDQTKLDEIDSSGNRHHTFETEKNQLTVTKQEPVDEQLDDLEFSFRSFSYETDDSFTVDTGIIITKEVDIDDVEEENGDQISVPYELDQMDDQSYDGAVLQTVKIEETGHIYINKDSLQDDNPLFFEEDTGSMKENDFDRSQRSNIYFDRNRIRLKAVSVVLKDLFPKNQDDNLDAGAESHLRSYNLKNPKSSEEIRICAEIKNREEVFDTKKNSKEQAVMKEWYSCTKCPGRYKFVSSLAQHTIKTHRFYACVHCESLFMSQLDLHIHKFKEHPVGKVHSCLYCDFKSKSAVKLRIHGNVHPDKKLFSCGECFFETDNSLLLLTHIERNHKKVLRNTQLVRKSTQEPKKEYKKVLTHAQPLMKGMKEHKKANYKKVLTRAPPVRKSTKEPKNAKECSRKAWYSCTMCPARFRFVSDLVRHLSKIHFLHLCVDCETLFMSQLDLDAHLLTHPVRKLHLCSYCSFKCKKASRLKIHANIIHPNETLFSCGQCLAEFYDSRQLFAHLVLKHGEVYSCALCSAKFKPVELFRSQCPS